MMKMYDSGEENGPEYCAGFFFRKLLSYHPDTVSDCPCLHGKKVSSTEGTHNVEGFYLFLKCYDKASLYKAADTFKKYGKCMVQISIYIFENFYDHWGIC